MNLTPKREVRLVVGGESRVELLPPEVTARGKAKATRRMMAGVVAIAVVISAGCYGAATLVASQSAARLESAQARTSQLIAEQAKFSEVGQVESQLVVARAARQVGTSTEIDWADYLAKVTAILPPGVVLTSVSTEGATPLAANAEVPTPLQGPRVGTIAFTATTPTVPDVSQWLESLATLPGFVDATPGSIEKGEAGYTTSITMHIDSGAYANRFAESNTDSGAQTEDEK